MNTRSSTTRRLLADARRHTPALTIAAVAMVVLLVSAAVAVATRPEAPILDAGLAGASLSPRVSPTASAPAASASTAPAAATDTPVVAVVPTVDPPADPGIGDSTGAGGDTDPTVGGTEPEPTDDPQGIDEEPGDVYVVPDPSVRLLINGDVMEGGFRIRSGDSVDVELELQATDLDPSACRLTQAFEPDEPDGSPSTKSLRPVPTQTVALADGRHTFVARCPSSAGELTSQIRAMGIDGRPEACRDFEFSRSDISVDTYEDLTAGAVGTWEGCVTTPWVPMYRVTVVLREDGTYSAKSGEVLDGQEMLALYYGTDDDDSSKVYAINDLQDSRLGVGQIDISFGPGSAIRDSLRNVRLMGDKLEFEVFHFEKYGPITFQLYRQ